MAIRPTVTEHMGVTVQDPMPATVAADNTGAGVGYPGYLGRGESHVTANGVPGTITSDDNYRWKGGTENLVVDIAIDGRPGRVSRLAYDSKGPAHSHSVESFDMPGSRIRPGYQSVESDGPVGSGVDLGNYLAVAMAQSTYNFPSEDLSQLRVLLGV